VVLPPTNQIVSPGATASFSVLASNNNAAAIGYQWQFNGANLTDATNTF